MPVLKSFTHLMTWLFIVFFVHMKSLSISLKTAHSGHKPRTFMSSSTHSFPNLPIPPFTSHPRHLPFLQVETQSSTLLRVLVLVICCKAVTHLLLFWCILIVSFIMLFILHKCCAKPVIPKCHWTFFHFYDSLKNVRFLSMIRNVLCLCRAWNSALVHPTGSERRGGSRRYPGLPNRRWNSRRLGIWNRGGWRRVRMSRIRWWCRRWWMWCGMWSLWCGSTGRWWIWCGWWMWGKKM